MSMFATWKAGDTKWKLDIPWMTDAERGALKHLRNAGHVTSFRVRQCLGAPLVDDKPVRCQQEVPIIYNEQGELAKSYCSKRCHDSIVSPED